MPAPDRFSAGGGLLLVDKPTGLTSHDVVARARRLLGTRRVGHAGTLDPMATGLLVLGVDRCTRLLGHLALTDKTYRATIRLGASTDTDDADGMTTTTAPSEALAAVTAERIAAGMVALTGALEQVPSAVSAIKVDGRRAYQRARAGEVVTLAGRTVTVSRFELTGPIRRVPGKVDLDVDVECSTGTYVRAVARDLGAALGVGGHLTALRRTRVGPFDVTDAVGVDAVRADRVIPAARAVRLSFPVRVVGDELADDVRHGRPIPATGLPGTYAAFDEAGSWLALLRESEGRARTVLGWSGMAG